jgi:hypothetical protein
VAAALASAQSSAGSRASRPRGKSASTP